MKTHDFAEAMMMLARVIRSGPDVELTRESLDRFLAPRPRNSDEIAVNLATLAALARIQKSEWISFVREYQIPIDLRARDASRDILGKLLRHLEDHPEERSRLERRTVARTAKESPELMKALTILLRDPKDRT